MTELRLRELYERHAWHVHRRAARLLGDEEEARDVCHEVFLRLAESAGAIRDERSLTAWVFRVLILPTKNGGPL